MVWAAVLAAGEGATLSHHSAAEAIGLVDRSAGPIHITIPAARHVKAPIHGVVLHRSHRLESARHPSRTPPQTRVEETVLDLVDAAKNIDEAIGWLTRACSSRRTTAARIARVLASRKRIKWRSELDAALADIESGATSPLELRYLRDVERPHGMPTAKRQARHERLGGSIYDDVHYAEYGVVAELDGRVAHIDSTFRDMERDNVAARRGDLVLHYGWDDVTNDPCRVAAEVCDILATRGWTNRPKKCARENCVIVGRG